MRRNQKIGLINQLFHFNESNSKYITIDILTKDKENKMVPYINPKCKSDKCLYSEQDLIEAHLDSYN